MKPFRMFRLAALGCAATLLALSGCVTLVGPDGTLYTAAGPAVPYYDPFLYDGYLVYYDSAGLPYYYLNGEPVYVPQDAGGYGNLIEHYRTYRPNYEQWYRTRGHLFYAYRHPNYGSPPRHPDGTPPGSRPPPRDGARAGPPPRQAGAPGPGNQPPPQRVAGAAPPRREAQPGPRNQPPPQRMARAAPPQPQPAGPGPRNRPPPQRAERQAPPQRQQRDRRRRDEPPPEREEKSREPRPGGGPPPGGRPPPPRG